MSFYSSISKFYQGIFVVLINNCLYARPKIRSFSLNFSTDGVFLVLSRCTLYTGNVSIHCICILTSFCFVVKLYSELHIISVVFNDILIVIDSHTVIWIFSRSL